MQHPRIVAYEKSDFYEIEKQSISVFRQVWIETCIFLFLTWSESGRIDESFGRIGYSAYSGAIIFVSSINIYMKPNRTLSFLKTGVFAMIALLLAGGCASRKCFTISAEMAGLQAGDTLLFTQCRASDYTVLATDTLIAVRSGGFDYVSRPIEDLGMFILSYRPAHAEPLVYCHRGRRFYTGPGERLTFDGTTEYYPAMRIRGGMYDDPRLQRIFFLEDSLAIESNRAYRKLFAARQRGDQDSVSYYVDRYREVNSRSEYRDLLRQFVASADDSPYAAAEYLETLHRVSLDEAQERYGRFTPEVRQSSFGRELERMLGILRNIEPGNTPSEFTVKTYDGRTIRLSDYRGKYLLLYHWGYCPGTAWVHPLLLNLYERFHKGGFEVLGFTNLDMDQLPDEWEEMEDFRPVRNHPWPTVHTTDPANAFIKEDYYFCGVPILLLIGPDGRTLLRGFTEQYKPLKELLKERIGE